MFVPVYRPLFPDCLGAPYVVSMETPWLTTVREQTLIVRLPQRYQTLSWAPLGGGCVEARTILNHQVDIHAVAPPAPEVYLQALARRLQVEFPVVGLMTGVLIERVVHAALAHNDLITECFATVGLSNALAAGDPATYEEHPGTINLILLVNQPLTLVAMLEALQIVTEAKTAALMTANISSTVATALATGTGTDCVVVACPRGEAEYRYCGKHTKLGELVGKVAREAMNAGIHKATAL